MEEKDQEKQEFLEKGIFPSTPTRDKKLFEELKSIIHEYVTRGGHNYKPDKFIYRASSIGTCSRKIILDRGPEQYLTPTELEKVPLWYLNQLDGISEEVEFGAHITGQLIHEVIQSALKNRILSMEEEVSKTVGKATIVGHYDLLLEYEDGQKIVIDIKSVNTPREYLPKAKHLRQLMAYQGMLGGIPGALLYVHRDTFELSYVYQDFDKNVYSEIMVKISELAKHESKGTLPPPIPEFSYECSSINFRCPYYLFCYKENNGEKTN